MKEGKARIGEDCKSWLRNGTKAKLQLGHMTRKKEKKMPCKKKKMKS